VADPEVVLPETFVANGPSQAENNFTRVDDDDVVHSAATIFQIPKQVHNPIVAPFLEWYVHHEL
jgi:hypothetical protein